MLEFGADLLAVRDADAQTWASAGWFILTAESKVSVWVMKLIG